jgi:AcrR family transcriptional regulator
MPPNPERRAQILDAAIDILVDKGIGGLTHRHVDGRAGVPAGTTSNYFRTRQALLEATAARTVDLHWQRVEALQSAIGPMTVEGVKALMVRMLDPDELGAPPARGGFRRWTLARFELFMEGTRRPELRPFIKELQAAAVKSARVIFEAAGLDPTHEQMEQLSRLLNGYAFSEMTIPDGPGVEDPAGLVDRLLRAFFDV